jgi:hypothetical protein
VTSAIPLKDWRQHLAETTGTWVRIGYQDARASGGGAQAAGPAHDAPRADSSGPKADPLERHGIPPTFAIEKYIWRALVAAFLLVCLVAIIRGLLHAHDGLQDRAVPIDIVTQKNPYVCGIEGEAVSAVLEADSEPKIYRVTCASGEVVWDWEW